MTRKMKTFLSLTLAASLLLGGCGASYTGGETDAAVPPSPTPTPTPVPVVSDSESLHPAKEETVYVTADASGRPEKIEVEAQLSGHPAGDIPDVAALTDIRNTEGEESWTAGENNTLLWENLGADIRYKGFAKADTELPVTETVTYYLDGEEIAPEALAGQSGHVKIVFSFENHTAETVDVVRKTRKAEGDDRFSVDLDLELGDEKAADSEKESDGSDADKKAAGSETEKEANAAAAEGSDSEKAVPSAGGSNSDGTKKKGGDDSEKDDEKEEPRIETSETITYADVPVPFTVITAVVLPEDTFADISVDNGRVLTMDGSQIAIGFALPGLASFLTADGSELTEDLDLPESITLEADVTDFSLDFTASIISPGLLADADLDSLDDLADLRGDMLSLTEAVNEIIDALSEMEDGTGDFSDGIEEYVDGVSALADGISQVSSGLSTLNENSAALTSGASALSTGLSQLSSSLPELPALPEIDTTAMEKAAAALTEDLTALSAGLTAIGDADDTVASLITALGTAAGHAEEAADLLAAYEENKPTIQSALTDSAGVLSQASAALEEAAAAAGAAAQSSAKSQVAAAAAEVLATTDLPEEEQAALAGQIAEQVDISAAVTEAVLTSQSGLTKALADAQKAITEAGAQLALPDGNTDAEALGSLAASLRALADELTDGALAKTLADAEALQEATAASGLPELLAAAEESIGQADGKTAGLSEWKDVLQGLKTNYESLTAGIDALSKGAAQLSEGLGAYTSGVSQLSSGAAALKSGSNTLESYGGDLTDGASQLSDAVTKFREGFEEFRDDGVTELTDFVDKDLSGLADRALALQEADGRYQTWSGLAEGTEGSVRFIIETGEIKAEG